MAAVAYAETSLALLTTQACAVDWSRQAGDQIPSRVRSLILNPAILSYSASLRCAHQGHRRFREESLLPLLPPDYLDQHPLPPPAVKTHVSAVQLTQKIRSQVPKSSCPLVTATTTAALGGPCRFRWASAVLSLRPGQGLAQGKGLPRASLAGAVVQPASGPAWSIGACGASLSSHFS